jgi:thioesterase domain-containing protein
VQAIVKPVASTDDADALAAVDASFRTVPPSAALGLRAVALEPEALRVHAPLAANLNDKGCAFGGSLASVMTLAAWGLVVARLRADGIVAEVYVADSRIRYLAPLYADLDAQAWLTPDTDWATFRRCLLERGRARASLAAAVRDATGLAVATMEARFAAMRPPG